MDMLIMIGNVEEMTRMNEDGLHSIHINKLLYIVL